MEVTVITNIRRKVLTMLSKMAYDGNLPDHVYDILQIVNENTPRTRCCVHKERAVLKERICVALGVDTDMNIIDAANKAISEPVDRTQHVIAVLPEGCSACPVNKYMITDMPCIPVPTRRQKSTRTSVWNAVPAVGPAPSAPSRNGATSSN